MSGEASDALKGLADFWTGLGLPGSDPAATPELVQAGETMMQLWATAAQLSNELARHLGEASGSPAADILERLTNPRHWLPGTGDIDEALARMADGPRFAGMGEFERRWASVVQRWSELRQRGLEHQRVVLGAWMEAGRQYLNEAAGKTLNTKEAVALWAEIGNRHMLEVQRSEPFLSSQRDLIRASTELRVAQNELSECIGTQFGLPTRSELDDVHRSMTEMRRELRTLRREVDAAKQAASPADSSPAVRSRTSRAGGSRSASSKGEAR